MENAVPLPKLKKNPSQVSFCTSNEDDIIWLFVSWSKTSWYNPATWNHIGQIWLSKWMVLKLEQPVGRGNLNNSYVIKAWYPTGNLWLESHLCHSFIKYISWSVKSIQTYRDTFQGFLDKEVPSLHSLLLWAHWDFESTLRQVNISDSVASCKIWETQYWLAIEIVARL